MGQQSVPDLKELFRQAAEIAEQVPESMQEAAFNRALDLLVGSSEPPTQAVVAPPSTLEPGRSGGAQEEADGGSDSLVQIIDSTQHPAVRTATKVLDRALMVLQIALRDHNVDGLTPVEIARVLTEKFRLRTSRQAVGMALKDVSDLVDRVPEGRGYRYRIMGPGEDYLAHLEDGGESEDSTAAATRRPATRRKKAASGRSRSKKQQEAEDDASSSEQKRTKAKRSPSSKLGPKAAITGLIGEGFFDTPKSGPDVQAFLKKKRGFDLGTDQLRLAMLRLVRDGVLERDENDEGQYEYKRP